MSGLCVSCPATKPTRHPLPSSAVLGRRGGSSAGALPITGRGHLRSRVSLLPLWPSKGLLSSSRPEGIHRLGIAQPARFFPETRLAGARGLRPLLRGR